MLMYMHSALQDTNMALYLLPFTIISSELLACLSLITTKLLKVSAVMCFISP